MNKRRLLLASLACAATGLVGAAVVPWAIVEWHIARIATDRDELLAAVVSPRDSWEWRAVKEYAQTSEGAERLRLEYAWSVCRTKLRGRPRKSAETGLLGVISRVPSFPWYWEVYVPLEDAVYFIPEPRIGTVRIRRPNPWCGQQIMEPRWPGKVGSVSLETSEERVAVTKGLAKVITPTSEPLTESKVELYVVRLSHPMIPAAGWLEAFVGSDPLVVFLKPWKPEDGANSNANTAN